MDILSLIGLIVLTSLAVYFGIYIINYAIYLYVLYFLIIPSWKKERIKYMENKK